MEVLISNLATLFLYFGLDTVYLKKLQWKPSESILFLVYFCDLSLYRIDFSVNQINLICVPRIKSSCRVISK